MNNNFDCPRCGGKIPSNKMPGAYPGAISRVDNKTEVCSACGMDEAMCDFNNIPLAEIEDWPVSRTHRPPITFAESDETNLLMAFGRNDNNKEVKVYTVDPSALLAPDARGEIIVISQDLSYVLINMKWMDDLITSYIEDGSDPASATALTLTDILNFATDLSHDFLSSDSQI